MRYKVLLEQLQKVIFWGAQSGQSHSHLE